MGFAMLRWEFVKENWLAIHANADAVSLLSRVT